MKKFLAASLIVGNLILMPISHAEITSYTANSEEIANQLESKDVVRLRAVDKAIKIASKQAFDALKSNSALNDDEIAAIIADTAEINIIEYIQEKSACNVAIEIKIDDSEIKNWLKRDAGEKFTLISQNLEINSLSETNERKIDDLRKRAVKISNSQEKKFFKSEFEYLNNEFLSNQKVAEGNKFVFRGRFDDAINLYTEAIKINEYNAAAYNFRGNLYGILAENQKNIPIAESNRRQALQDFDKALRLNSNYAEAYSNRGLLYLNAKNFTAAIKDFDRAIQLQPNIAQNYVYRGQCYRQTDKNSALNDFNKAIELANNNPNVYFNRGKFFEQDLKDFSKALEDYSRAIELETREDDLPIYFNSRGGVYRKLNLYSKAIDDYSRAISLLNEKNPLLAWIYRSRGECFKNLGDNSSSQADFKKFEELQRR